MPAVRLEHRGTPVANRRGDICVKKDEQIRTALLLKRMPLVRPSSELSLDVHSQTKHAPRHQEIYGELD